MVISDRIGFIIKDRQDSLKVQDVAVLSAATDFCIRRLWRKQEYKGKAFITINIVSNLGSELGSIHDRYGEMYELDSEDGQVREYVIDLLAEQSHLDTLKTLAHELVHVLQSYDRRLSVNSDGWMWYDTDFGKAPYKGDSSDDSLPWEVEAKKFETPLALSTVSMLYSVT